MKMKVLIRKCSSYIVMAESSEDLWENIHYFLWKKIFCNPNNIYHNWLSQKNKHIPNIKKKKKAFLDETFL